MPFGTSTFGTSNFGAEDINKVIKGNTAKVFRRAYIKRRLDQAAGGYGGIQPYGGY